MIVLMYTSGWIECDIRIVVVVGGFVFIREYVEDELYIHLSSASYIRVWGTTKGLGELVNKPTPDTVLDSCGLVATPMSQMLFNIKCASSWPI